MTQKFDLPRHEFEFTVPFGYEGDRLVAGKTYMVKVSQVLEAATSEECLEFLHSQNAILAGEQGWVLLQKEEQVPEGIWLVFFDEKEALRKDAAGDHGVQCVRIMGERCGWLSRLRRFEEAKWEENTYLAYFCDKS